MYGGLVRMFGVLMIGLGLALIVVTLTHGGGVGLILGALFVAAGAGRLWMARARP